MFYFVSYTEIDMKRKAAAIAVILVLAIGMMTLIAGASNYLPALDEKSMYYTPDYKSGDCILSSAKSMIRRAAVMRESFKWDSITNTSLRGKATTSGGAFRNSFSYSNDGITYSVITQDLTGNAENKMRDIQALLANHPEGVIVWGRNAAKSGPHGVLVTGISDGKLYAVDSTHNTFKANEGIEEWSKTTMKSISYCTDVWFFKSITGGASTTAAVGGASTLCATGVKQPGTLTKGKGFGVTGSIQSNYKIISVTVSIVNDKGISVISKSAKPGSCIYALGELDSKVKFGSLAAGHYTYRIIASDEKKGNAVLHSGAFEVVEKKKAASAKSGKTSKITISSVRAPAVLKKGKAFTIKGKLKSSAKIKNVKVQVLSASGKKVLSASSKPNKKTYNIKKLDKKIKFGKLKKGTYIFKVRAKNSSGWQTILSKSFAVE